MEGKKTFPIFRGGRGSLTSAGRLAANCLIQYLSKHCLFEMGFWVHGPSLTLALFLLFFHGDHTGSVWGK